MAISKKQSSHSDRQNEELEKSPKDVSHAKDGKSSQAISSPIKGSQGQSGLLSKDGKGKSRTRPGDRELDLEIGENLEKSLDSASADVSYFPKGSQSYDNSYGGKSKSKRAIHGAKP
jgi:hypothetical protein